MLWQDFSLLPELARRWILPRLGPCSCVLIMSAYDSANPVPFWSSVPKLYAALFYYTLYSSYNTPWNKLIAHMISTTCRGTGTKWFCRKEKMLIMDETDKAGEKQSSTGWKLTQDFLTNKRNAERKTDVGGVHILAPSKPPLKLIPHLPLTAFRINAINIFDQ